jgi:hypothetical protein
VSLKLLETLPSPLTLFSASRAVLDAERGENGQQGWNHVALLIFTVLQHHSPKLFSGRTQSSPGSPSVGCIPVPRDWDWWKAVLQSPASFVLDNLGHWYSKDCDRKCCVRGV